MLGTSCAPVLQPGMAGTELLERSSVHMCITVVSLPGVDVRMKPIPALPSPLPDAPSWLRSSFLVSLRVLLVLLSPVCKNKVSKIFTRDTFGSLV